MTENDARFRKFVEEYDIEVPQEAIDNEYEFILQDMRHRMQYNAMAGGESPLEAKAALKDQEEEFKKLALFEAKSGRVLKDIIKKQNITASPEELEEKAKAIAEEDHSTLEMVQRFFGEDLALLEGDVKRQKALDWIETQL